ncbi:MAG: SRPBCC family protein, partial [Actinomycetota bacterium]
MVRSAHVDIAQRGIRHLRDGSQDLVPSTVRVPASNYLDPARWRREVERLFVRLPLVVGLSSELDGPGDALTGEIVGTSYLVTRAGDGALCAEVASDDEARSARAEERCGLVFLVLAERPSVDLDTALCGYAAPLDDLGLASGRVVGRNVIAGPNWKLAYDGYLDYYHLPVLHRETFGPDMSTQAMYDAWGPHQRVTAPDRHWGPLAEAAEEDWSLELLLGGVWTIFPHVSIASFDAGGKLHMISQLFPGREVGASVTVQTFVAMFEPTAEHEALIAERMAFLEHVVRDEDYFTGLRIQRALATGARDHVLFGRNEGGGQRFHRWVDAILGADDEELA